VSGRRDSWIILLTFGESRMKKGAAISSSFIRWEKSATV